MIFQRKFSKKKFMWRKIQLKLTKLGIAEKRKKEKLKREKEKEKRKRKRE